MEHDNGDGTTGTYVLDPGTYYFAAGNGAHDALNNILVLQGADKSKMVGTGSAAAAVAQEITEDRSPALLSLFPRLVRRSPTSSPTPTGTTTSPAKLPI